MANKDNSEAAKKIADAEKAKKSSKPKNKKGNIFARMGKAIARFFKDSKGDLKKITWPGAKEVLKGTAVTIVSIAIIGAIVFVIDLGLTSGIKGLRKTAENRTSTTTTTAVEETTVAVEETTLAVEETTAAPTAAETTTAAK